jgi:hypothetical protein
MNKITITKTNYQTGSFYHGNIMVGDRKVGHCRIGCPDPAVSLAWDDVEGQPLIVTLMPELQNQDMNNLHNWLGKQIRLGKIKVIEI